MKLCILLLTCANDKEADKITKALLEKRLIVCSKKTSVSSIFSWKGKVNSSNEILLIMDSVEENFDKIEAKVRKLHSYETFVLTALPISQTTKKVKDWTKKEISRNGA